MSTVSLPQLFGARSAPYFWGIARLLPLPLAGEGWGEGVCDRDGVACFSLTLALSQRERELLFPQAVS